MALGAVSHPIDVFADSARGKGAIFVDQPKQYSYRYLEDQLRALNEQLSTLSTLNAEAVRAAQGSFQGSSNRQSAFNLSIAEIGLPMVETVFDKDTDTKLKETTTQSAIQPTPPEVPSIAAPAAPLTNFGPNAQDLLEEQVRLRHQISNLRLLLDQAVSDKFIVQTKASGEVHSRLQVLLGFRVSVIPTSMHRDHAAVVEVKVKAPPGKQAPSVMALMPEEKSYNATAMTQKRNAFGAAALAGVFTVGAAGSRSSDIFYIYQDTDTFAFEKTEADSAAFGWQFRPVLNQRTVQPGPRYLFVALALDEVSDVETTELTVEMTSYWQKYNRKKRVSGKFARFIESLPPESVAVLTEAKLQEELAPQINGALATSVQDGMVNVRVEGSDIYPGSKVLIGGKYVADDAIIHRSEHYLEFFAPTRELLGREVHIISPRYGFSSLVQEPELDPPRSGFSMYYELGDMLGNQLVLKLVLFNEQQAEALPDLAERDVFVTLGDEIHVLRGWVESVNSRGQPILTRNLVVDAKRWLTSVQTVNIEIPFLGRAYEKVNESLPFMTVNNITLIADDGANVEWALFGTGFDADHLPKIYAGKQLAVSFVSERELRIRGPKSELGKQKTVRVMIPHFNIPLSVAAPGQIVPEPRPTPAAQPQQVVQSDSTAVEFAGTNLQEIKKVEFEGKPVVFAADNTKLTAYLTRDATKQPGWISLIAYYGENTFIPLTVNILPKEGS